MNHQRTQITKAKPLLFTFGLLFAALATGAAQPVIDSQPRDQTNVVSTTATFSVTATGESPLNYQWAFGSPPVNLDGATNATLVLTNVQVTNQGPYQVVVTNLDGAITSIVANLYVVPPPLLQFAASSYTVAESAGSVTLTVLRTASLGTTVSVDYATADLSATNGLKYMSVSGRLVIGSNETNQTIVVPILDEGFVEGTKNFRVTLGNPTGGAILGTRTNATVLITDNDVGVQFQFATYSVAEDAGAVLIAVVRGDDGTLPVTVQFAASDLTATNGLDYVGTNVTLSLAPQERLRFVSIPIINHSLKQPNRTFRVSLANPGGASLGAQSSATVTIVDNDQGFQFASGTYTVAEDAEAALIGVLRGTDDTSSNVTVDYATSDGSAGSGLDYTGTTNTLLFAPGERVKTVIVPILNNGIRQAYRYFLLRLSNPTGGAVLGSRTTATASILDNDSGVGFEQSAYTNYWGQGAGFTVTVLRGNDWFLGPITVDYTTANYTATAGQDYQAISGTVKFQLNETVKTLTIPILRGRAPEGTKYFRVTLSNVTGRAALGTYSSATVYIVGTYFTLAPPSDAALAIQRNGAFNTLTWAGGGLLQRADSPAGPWQTLTNAKSPITVQSPIPTTFYRVTRPRPVSVYVPSSYDGKNPMPLIILLHGYGGTGSGQESYMQFQPLAESRGFLYCYPDSTFDRWGNEFWNATDASAYDFGSAGVDDAGYLRALIQEIEKQFAVDRKRVCLIGHSNGGFMAYRMACQSADLIAGIASLGGTTFLDPRNCAPSQPVNILHIHGTADDIVPYAGGAITTTGQTLSYPANMPPFSGALQDVQIWAGYNGAGGPVTDSRPSLDLTTDVGGLDTVVTHYTNSPAGGAVELWTINGGSHFPTLSSQFSPLVIDWLLAHPKP